MWARSGGGRSRESRRGQIQGGSVTVRSRVLNSAQAGGFRRELRLPEISGGAGLFGDQNLSPRLRRLCAALARSSAALAPYRASIFWERHPASRSILPPRYRLVNTDRRGVDAERGRRAPLFARPALPAHSARQRQGEPELAAAALARKRPYPPAQRLDQPLRHRQPDPFVAVIAFPEGEAGGLIDYIEAYSVSEDEIRLVAAAMRRLDTIP